MLSPPPRSTLTDTLVSSTPLFRSHANARSQRGARHARAVDRLAHDRKRLVFGRRDDDIVGFGNPNLELVDLHGHDILPIGLHDGELQAGNAARSEEHTSELQSLMRSSYAVSCLKNNSIHDIQ